MKLADRKYSKHWNKLRKRRFPGYQIKVWHELSAYWPIEADALARIIIISEGCDPKNEWYLYSYRQCLKNFCGKRFVNKSIAKNECNFKFRPTFYGIWTMFLKDKGIV